jgi:hypothetical protein
MCNFIILIFKLIILIRKFIISMFKLTILIFKLINLFLKFQFQSRLFSNIDLVIKIHRLLIELVSTYLSQY